MPKQLIYTSAKRGYDIGRSGYCTVARSPDLRKPMILELESISKYDFKKSDSKEIFSYRIFELYGERNFVCSRIADCGFDYTGRTNFIAHHIVFSDSELSHYKNPAFFILNFKGWKSSWNESPTDLGDVELAETIYNSKKAIFLPSEKVAINIVGVDEKGFLEFLSDSFGAKGVASWEFSFTTRLQINEYPSIYSFILSKPGETYNGFRIINPYKDDIKKIFPDPVEEKKIIQIPNLKNIQTEDFPKYIVRDQVQKRNFPVEHTISKSESTTYKWVVLLSVSLSFTVVALIVIYLNYEKISDLLFPSEAPAKVKEKEPQKTIRIISVDKENDPIAGVIVSRPEIIYNSKEVQPLRKNIKTENNKKISKNNGIDGNKKISENRNLSKNNEAINGKKIEDSKESVDKKKKEILPSKLVNDEGKKIQKILGIEDKKLVNEFEEFYVVDYKIKGDEIDYDINSDAYKFIEGARILNKDSGLSIKENKLFYNDKVICDLNNEVPVDTSLKYEKKRLSVYGVFEKEEERKCIIFLLPGEKFETTLKFSDLFNNNHNLKSEIFSLINKKIIIKDDLEVGLQVDVENDRIAAYLIDGISLRDPDLIEKIENRANSILKKYRDIVDIKKEVKELREKFFQDCDEIKKQLGALNEKMNAYSKNQRQLEEIMEELNNSLKSGKINESFLEKSETYLKRVLNEYINLLDDKNKKKENKILHDDEKNKVSDLQKIIDEEFEKIRDYLKDKANITKREELINSNLNKIKDSLNISKDDLGKTIHKLKQPIDHLINKKLILNFNEKKHHD